MIRELAKKHDIDHDAVAEDLFAPIDWDVKIEQLPPRRSEQVVVKFIQGSYHGNLTRAEESRTATISTVGVRYCPEEDPTSTQTMRMMERSEALSFWRDEAEDIYSHDQP